MPNRNQSRNSKIRTIIRNLVRHQQYLCPIWAETICRTTRDDVHTHLQKNYPDKYEGFAPSNIPEYVERGRVLTDSRGRGAFQK